MPHLRTLEGAQEDRREVPAMTTSNQHSELPRWEVDADVAGFTRSPDGNWVDWANVEGLIEQLEAAESILRLADSPVIHSETWAEGVHARARAYWRGSNPASRPRPTVPLFESGRSDISASVDTPAKRQT